MTLDDLKSEIRPACEREGVRRLELFGSRARSGDLTGRDFDFLATFPDVPAVEYARRFFGLLHSLEDILGAPVDLLTVQSLRRQQLRRNIDREKICVYES